ncbi:hypothetical protein BDR05DRAFT_507024 [Suillus weaverae]|nr:hypothetical protein BDR05DRAFT_507024 [Suillus weaverae]
MGLDALNGVHHNEAAGRFTAAVNALIFSSTSAIHSKYELFVVLFGWNLKSLWRTAHQNRCHALFQAGRLPEALESYRYMMERSDEATKASCFEWSTAFKRDYSALCAAKGVIDFAASGDAAFAAGEYDRAIELCSAAIDMDFATDTVFATRSKARLEKMLWDDALLDAEKVIELNRSSNLGYQLKHAALHGAQRYDEALETFQVMLSDTQLQELCWQHVSPSEAECAIQKTIKAQLDNAPHRLLNTFTGRLSDQVAQINAFRTSTEYKELFSSTMKHPNLRMEHIQNVVATYFRYVMLSHRWEGKELLLDDIQDKDVFEFKPVEGIAKLQSFCKTARDAGYRWAWIDTCCVNQSNNVELQESVNSMFAWYHHSALTIVYLSDVPPSSKSGSLARSAWNTRGWTVQEFLAPKIVLFYQKDWSLYLNDCSHNHKECPIIMQEMRDATGIDLPVLVTFRPGLRRVREKLQWASTRVTTRQEDIAYSLFGIFGVNLPVIYGEKKQNALGRLLQEIVARSGDITALNWVGKPSEFNSCLPADITSYKAPPCTLPSLQMSVSLLRPDIPVDSAVKLYTLLDNLNAPRFANCRLHLPCIAFRVTAVRRQEMNFSYEVKADMLQDLQITTEDKLVQLPSLQPMIPTFLLVRPWNRLLELPDFAELSGSAELPVVADDTQSEEDYWSAPSSPSQDFLSDRALQLTVRLGQPFSAFLLAQQRGGEYKRIASDHDITAQVKDVSSIPNMDVRTLEIL